MKSISRQKNNIGGISRLYAVPIEILTAIAATAVDGVYDITLSSTDDVYDIGAVSETIRGSEEMKQTGAGIFYQHVIQATVAKDTPELQLALQELIGKRLILIYRDQNDRFKLIGNLTEAIRLTFKSDTGARVSDLQNASFSFEGKTTSPAKFIENPFT